MGSITDIFDTIFRTFRSLIGTGSAAVETGSGAAYDIFNTALGSVEGIVAGE